MAKAPCVVFYSYKGGTAKTLSTAQLGVALAAMGKSVCLIDFDLEAPGLALALPALLRLDGITGAQAITTLGLVDYIDDFAEIAMQRGWLKTCGVCGNVIPTEDLDPKILHDALPPVSSKVVRYPLGHGHILWMSAGRLSPPPKAEDEEPSYWSKLHSTRVQAVVGNNTWSAPFFMALIDRVRSELKVDYVIVDSRSGVNELSGTCTRALADKLVLLLGLQEEGYYGTNLVLRNLEWAKTQPHLKESWGPSRKNIYIVVSRIPETVIYAGKPVYITRGDEDARLREIDSVPGFTWPERLDSLRKRLSEGLRGGFNYDTFVLASAPNLEWEQSLPLPCDKPALQSKLTFDYIDLFEGILSNEEPDLRAQLLPYTRDVLEIRPYYWDRGSGAMYNPDDGKENVAFKVSTYVATLEAVCQREENRIRASRRASRSPAPSEEEVQAAVAEALLDIGRSAAGDFSRYLASERFAGRDKSRAGLWEEVNEWCHFDSKVGFGRFEAQPWGTGDEEGQIIVHNNFLARDRDSDRQNLCPFLTGYITSVLNSIYAPNAVTVTHDLKTGCAQKATRRGTTPACVFKFTIATGTGTTRKRKRKGK